MVRLVEAPGARRLAWPIAVVAVSVALIALSISLASTREQEVLFAVISGVGVVAFAGIGALVASRTGNAIGWIFLLIVSMLALYGVASAYGYYAAPRGLVLGELALATEWPFIAMLALFGWIFLLFPTGTLPSPRWKWIARIYATAVVLLAVGWAIRPARLTVDDVVVGSNPLGIQVLGRPLGPVLALFAFTLLACAFLSVVALVVRFRNADPEQRQQIRWLAYVGILAAVTLPILMVIGSANDGNPGNRGLSVANGALSVFLLVVIVIGIPVAAGVSILKYRLWDLDVVVKKTLVASVLTLLLAVIGLFLIYLGGQFAFWEGETGVS